jgi:16S rRNA (guanine527-N7)-methyltransferase
VNTLTDRAPHPGLFHVKPSSLSPSEIEELLLPFEVRLTPDQLSQLLTYLELLMRWNEHMNLTAVRDARQVVTRHFGESLYLPSWAALAGHNLDIGSGAGFPGLALKIVCPDLTMTLLEPVAKKRAFLKEVVRICGFAKVAVRPERLEQFHPPTGFESATARAVGRQDDLIREACQRVISGGRLYLWLTLAQGESLEASQGPQGRVAWMAPRLIPGSNQSAIYTGVVK